MVLYGLLIIVGLLFLVKGADWLVEGSSALARKYKISDLVIGLTIVAFGTSMPELVVNVFAAAQKHPDLVLGNIVGSNNFNLFVILGITGVIVSLSVQSSTIWKEIPFSLVAAILLFVLANDSLLFGSGNSKLSRLDGFILLIGFAAFLYYVYRQVRNSTPTVSVQTISFSSLKLAILIVGGLAALIIGGRMVVTAAVSIAQELGISEKVIGLTIVAMGTSLPELATSVVAALKKNSEIAIGNIVGSNIFNILFILGVSSLITPISFNVAFNTELIMLVLGTIILFVFMFSGYKKQLDRWEAALFLLFFILYTVFLILKEG